eukprot:174825_1
MDAIDHTHVVDNVHFSQTQYKLVNTNNQTSLDKIYQYLTNNIDGLSVEVFKNFIEEEEYDSDCVEYDMPNANILNCIQLIQNAEIVEAIHRIVTQPNVNHRSNDVCFKYNASFNIFPG